MIKNFGYVLASKMLVENNRKVRFMYREESTAQDSGWRFFCGDEDQAYADKPENIAIYDIQAILKLDKDVRPYLCAAPGSAFERLADSDAFQKSSDFDFEAEEV